MYLETRLNFKNNWKITSCYNLLIFKFQIEKFVSYEKNKIKNGNLILFLLVIPFSKLIFS